MVSLCGHLAGCFFGGGVLPIKFLLLKSPESKRRKPWTFVTPWRFIEVGVAMGNQSFSRYGDF